MSAAEPPPDSRQVRASQLLRVRELWAAPAIIASVLAMLMTVLYIGSVVDPAAHLRGLPVAVVNEDPGTTIGSRHVDFGQQLDSGLLSSPQVSTLLGLKPSTLAQAQRTMDSNDAYATIVIPQDFTASLLEVSGVHSAAAIPVGKPIVELLTNPRAGTEGVALATNVVQPAIARASLQIGRQLIPIAASNRASSAAAAPVLADPLSLSTIPYRPPPRHSALGLSAFYISLLTIICGFFTALILQASVDAALGYATTEIGTKWRQRPPQAISRWQTLLTKWVMAFVLSALLTGVMVAVAAGIIGMDAPTPGYLWLFTWVAAAVVAVGTLTLLAVLGTPGQLLALILFVYAGLASAGGTVPLEALPGFFKFLSNFEPLRQILSGVRAILYFDARADAGLTRGIVATGVGLIFWLALGTTVVTWYDRRKLFRLHPTLVEYVNQAASAYRAQRAEQTHAAGAEDDPRPATAEATETGRAQR